MDTIYPTKELLARSSLETHKLDLMAEISSLKIRLASAEKDRRELDDKVKISQRQILELEAKLNIKDAEISDLRQRLTRNGTVVPPPEHNGDPGHGHAQGRTLERERTLDRLKRKQHEVEKLKKAVDALMLSNEEKDRRIDDLRKLLRRYKKVEEMVIQAQGRKALDELMCNMEDDTSSTSSTTPSVTDPGVRDSTNLNSEDSRPNSRHYIPTPSATSTPVNSFAESPRPASNHVSSLPSTIQANTPRRSPAMVRSNSAEDLAPAGGGQKGSPPGKRKTSDGYSSGTSYGTLPKERDDRDHRRSRGFPGWGKTLLRVRSGKRSCSAPNLGNAVVSPSRKGKKNKKKAHTEVVTDDEDGLQHIGMAAGMPLEAKKKRGLKRFFGRIKRSSSQDFNDKERLEEFRRGGIRATATARLGWTKDLHNPNDPAIPFQRWDGDRVTAWMNEIGLNMYLVECRRWIRNGDQLIRASQHDIEKELGIKNSLHRKKLQLALQGVGAEGADRLGELDHNWVTRWLDDIGLPQYKDQFYDSRVDGRMLHYLTVDDLMFLKVTNELHHISIKRGIQILRVHGFNPQCLRRRPSPDEGPLQSIPGDVALWTTHRVMEWLRTIDLSEYAPNLRGSGVHGALMVLEPRFNSELFALLLSIPQSKTLLRRHLSTHFVALVGNEIQHKKREFEASPGYAPLIPNAKIRHRGKFGIFGHKRSKSETEADGFICPMDMTGQSGGSKHSNGSAKKPEKDEKAAKEIGAFSKEINSLTDMLAHDKFLETVPTSNV